MGPDIAATDGEDLRGVLRRAGRLLSDSRGYRETLEGTLAACLPALGDFGFFDVLEGDDAVRVAKAHDDEALEAMLRPARWVRQARSDMNVCALSTGEAALHAGIDDAWYRAVAVNEEHLAILRRLAFRSMVTVPMHYRGALVGALTLFMAGSGRRHTRAHLEKAEDLAHFAAPLVVSARLVERNEDAQAALRRSEERLRLTYQAAGLGAWEWSIEENTVYWSPEYREIYGLPADAAPSFAQGIAVVVEEDRAAVHAAMRAALEERVEFRSEHRIRHPAHGLRWVQTIGRPICDEAGRPVRVAGVAMDVTDRLRTSHELQALRDQLAEELDAMRRLQDVSSRLIRRHERIEDVLADILDAALAISGRGRGKIQLLDPATGTLRLAVHRGFDEALCAHFREVGPDDSAPSAIALRRRARIVIEDIAADPQMAGTVDLAMLLQAGVRSVQSTPLVSRDGRVIGMFTTHGAAPQKPGERELRLLDLLSRTAADLIDRAQAEEALKDSDRRKDEFLAILAHELRNPLAPIRYAVAVARDPKTGSAQRLEADAIIERQVRHMGRLLDDLLDVSRIARGTVELRRERLQLATVVASAVEAARPAIEAKGHALSVEVGEAPVWLDADPVRLTQILANLLTNAAKYTDRGGRVALCAAVESGTVRIAVRDNGIGIAPEMKPRLFTLFSQADSALHRAEGGLGIGLALVRGFVGLHGGTIEALSEGLGRGSEFVVRLPVAAAPAPHTDGAPLGHLGEEGLRVLVADDNADGCRTCAMLVSLWGHEVRTAASGSEALALLESWRPDVALVDIGMPGLNGYQVAARVRQSPWGAGIRLIAVTGWGQEEARRRSLDAGFDEHLTKPVDAARLERVLGEAALGA